MSVPPVLTLAVVPAVLVTTWLYVHSDEDVKTRADVQRAEMRVEKARFDKDFAALQKTEKSDLEILRERIVEAEANLAAAEAREKQKSTNDQRSFVKNALDDLFKPEPLEANK